MSIYIEKNLICIQGDQDLKKKKTALVSGEKKKKVVFFGYEIQ